MFKTGSTSARRIAGLFAVLVGTCAAWGCGSSSSGDDDDDDVATVDGGGGVIDGDATAFRIDRFELRDPHIYIDLLGCTDVTDEAVGGDGLNDVLQTMITTDDDGDGLLDLSMILVFRPLDQDSAEGVVQSGVVECTAPLASTTCQPIEPLEPTAFTNTQSGTCLAPFPGTTSSAGYSPGVSAASAPCFTTNAQDIEFDFGGVPATLAGNQSSATYTGSPATTLTSGNVRAFISEADAAAVLLPIEGVGDIPLIDLLPGSSTNCALHDDRDTGPDGVTRGWWFYFDFSARKVPWTGE